MAQSVPVNGEGNPRRKMTPFNEYKQKFGITDDLAPAEKLEKLHSLFTLLANSSRAISDNLQPGELQRRLTADEKVPCTLEQMQILLEEDEHAVSLLHDCVEEMRASPMSALNGTSLRFAQCARTYLEEKERFETGKQELAGLLHQDGTGPGARRHAGGWKPALVCLAVQVASFFLVFEDMIAA